MEGRRKNQLGALFAAKSGVVLRPEPSVASVTGGPWSTGRKNVDKLVVSLREKYGCNQRIGVVLFSTIQAVR